LAAANTAGSTKKAITSGAIFIGRSNERYCISALILRGYNVGNIAAAYLVFNEERPIKYRSTWISVLVGMVFTIFASLFLRYWYIRENKRRDSVDAAATMQGGSQDKLHEASDSVERENRIVERLDDYQDLTDKQRRDFRYVY
jgi:hypothetical protein